MREIKFRAWDNYTNEMVANDNLAIVGGNPAYTIQGDVPLVIDSLIVMQYTGLKDEGLKDIYEGDILSMSYAPMANCRGKVVFEKGAFYFITKEADPLKSLLHDIPELGNYLTIIGNVYQDIELSEAV